MKIRIYDFVAGMLLVEVGPNWWIWCKTVNNQLCQHTFVDIYFNIQSLILLVVTKMIFIQFKWRSVFLILLQACWLLRCDQICEYDAKPSTINFVNMLLLTFISMFNVWFHLLLRKWSSCNSDEDPYFLFCCRHVGCWSRTKFVNMMQNCQQSTLSTYFCWYLYQYSMFEFICCNENNLHTI
jgi:hypothetical protein